MRKHPLKIFWIRHAPVEKSGRYIGQTDIPAIIPEQAANLAMDLPKNSLWFSSPLLRSKQTANWLMASYPQMMIPEIDIASELSEQNFGVWEGKTYDEVWSDEETLAQSQDWTNPAIVKPEGGESFIGVCARVDHWIEERMAEDFGLPLVVVAHSGTIRAALRHALNLVPSQALSFAVDYGSVTEVEYAPSENTAMVHFVNR